MNLIDTIEAEMRSDEANREKQSTILKKVYKGATPEQQELMDEVTICLCGWSLKTLIEKSE